MPKIAATPQLVLHVPVLHRGYVQLFQRLPKISKVWIIGEDFISQLDYLRKDLRALKPAQMVDILKAMDRFDDVRLLNHADLAELDQKDTNIIMADEDISRLVGAQFKRALVSYEPVFLRWDRRNVEAVDAVNPNETITTDRAAQKLLSSAAKLSIRSSDIWRRVGAILVDKNGQVISENFNHSDPSDYTPMAEGDPRNLYNRGAAIELSVFTHAEAKLIAEAAKGGKKLAGSSLYVTTFPCPACAKLIAHSGIAEVYYQTGYAVLDGERVLKDHKVKLVKVVMGNPETTNDTWVPYPKST